MKINTFIFDLLLGNVLDEAINGVMSETSCPCSPQQCADDKGYRIGIALIQKMVIDNEVHSMNEDASGLALIKAVAMRLHIWCHVLF